MFSNRLPSTASLRAFECAARHLTCTGAASELCLSQSAVSKQLRGLEIALGTMLFERTAWGLELTEDGKLYLGTARRVLQQLKFAGEGLGGVGSPDSQETINLRLPAALAERWFLPRFAAFARLNPHILVQFTRQPGVLSNVSPDAEIRFGEGPWSGHQARYLVGNETVLIANPKLVHQIEVSGDLHLLWSSNRLVHFQAEQHWEEFSLEYDQHNICEMTAKVVRFGYYSVLLQAVSAGLGIALIPKIFAAEALNVGQVVNPLQMTFRSSLGYHLLQGEEITASENVQKLMAWLTSQST